MTSLKCVSCIIILLFVQPVFLSAAISKVYISHASETLGSNPINGNSTWSTYMGSSKLAFARQHYYKVRIEYAAFPVGILGVSTPNVTLSQEVRSGNRIDFTLSVSPLARRLDAFKIYLYTPKTAEIDPIPCEVVEIGTIYSMVLEDVSNTTMNSYNMTGSTALPDVTLFFKNNSGSKKFIYYGSKLANAKIMHNSSTFAAPGMSVLANLSNQSDTSFTVTATPNSVNSNTNWFRSAIFNKIVDNAADKPYSWVLYRFAQPVPIENSDILVIQSTDGSNSSSVVTGTSVNISINSFEILPGRIVELGSNKAGYHNVMKLAYQVVN